MKPDGKPGSMKVRVPEDKHKAMDLIDAGMEGIVELKPEWMRAF
jgi:hypothetical protein